MKISRLLLLILVAVSCLRAFAAEWIWNPEIDPHAQNRFTYFRKIVRLDAPAPEAIVLFAADSNARLIVNGQVVRRKVTRYSLAHVRPERVVIGPYLRAGENTLVVLHHNWGPIRNFQREAGIRGGLWIEPVGPGTPAGFATDATWETGAAPEFLPHETQILGVTKDPRIRFPVVIAGGAIPDLSSSAPSPIRWIKAQPVTQPIWTIARDREIPPQREFWLPVQRVLAIGAVDYVSPHNTTREALARDVDFPAAMGAATNRPEAAALAKAAKFPLGDLLTLTGNPGETKYVTFDFHQPVHGFPGLALRSSAAGVAVSLGYGELNESHYDGTYQVDLATGKIRTEQIVGSHYGDRYLTAGKASGETVEFPDERTARYLTVHVTFPDDAAPGSTVTLTRAGLFRSQYPVTWSGSFASGDLQVAQIIELSRIHAEVTMSDTYVDTPGREDGQWLEDIQLRGRLSETWGRDATLRRLTLLHVEETRREGRFLSFTPQSYGDVSSWDWGMQWITMLNDEWHWSHDEAFLRARFPTLESYLELMLQQVDATGLFRTNRLFADIRVGTAPRTPQDVSAIGQTWLIEKLREAAGLARAVQRDDLASRWSALREKMLTATRDHLVIREGRDASYVGDILDAKTGRPEGKSQAAQLAAIEAGVFEKSEARRILDAFFPAPAGQAPDGVAPWNNPTYLYRALKMLSDHGLGERALAHLRWRLAPYLPFNPANGVPLELQGPAGGPLPEYFVTHRELGLPIGTPAPAQPIDPTGSHGWAAVSLVWLHDTVLGVTWDNNRGTSGRLQVRIAPQTFGLPTVSGWVQTPGGPVFVDWQPARFRLEVTIPANAGARIVFPLSGLKFKASESTVAQAPRGDADGAQIEQPGTYVFGL